MTFQKSVTFVMTYSGYMSVDLILSIIGTGEITLYTKFILAPYVTSCLLL